MTKLTITRRMLVALCFVVTASASLLAGCNAEPKKAEAPPPPPGVQYQRINSNKGASVAGTSSGKLKTLKSFRDR